MLPSLLDDLPTTLLWPLLSAPGADEAWRVFLGRYWPRVVAWARRGGARRDDAEQIASEVVLKLARPRTRALYDHRRGHVRPWVRTIVHSTVLDFRKKLTRTPGGVGRGNGGDDPLDALLDPASLDGLADDLDAQMSRDLQAAEAAVERVRRRVQDSTWEAYYRTAILGREAVAVADDLGLSIRAVYMARRRVGRMLEEEGRAVLG